MLWHVAISSHMSAQVHMYSFTFFFIGELFCKLSIETLSCLNINKACLAKNLIVFSDYLEKLEIRSRLKVSFLP